MGIRKITAALMTLVGACLLIGGLAVLSMWAAAAAAGGLMLVAGLFGIDVE